jgi:hypothetical protein
MAAEHDPEVGAQSAILNRHRQRLFVALMPKALKSDRNLHNQTDREHESTQHLDDAWVL